MAEQIPNQLNLAEDQAGYRDIREEHLRIEAAKENCDIIYSLWDELLLDIDDAAKRLDVPFVGDWLACFDLDVVECFGWRSKTGNQHFKIRVSRSMDANLQSLLQMALGSDIKRELMNQRRNKAYGSPSNVLFHPKNARVHQMDIFAANWFVPYYTEENECTR